MAPGWVFSWESAAAGSLAMKSRRLRPCLRRNPSRNRNSGTVLMMNLSCKQRDVEKHMAVHAMGLRGRRGEEVVGGRGAVNATRS